MVILLLKYDFVYKVSIQGIELGYVNNKDEIECMLNDVIHSTGKEVSFVIVENLPKFDLVLNSEGIEIDNDIILEKIFSKPFVAYKTYAVVLDNEEKQVVNSYDEAKKIVDEIEKNIDDDLELTLGIKEVYTYNCELESLPEITVAKAVIEEDVNQRVEILKSTINGVYLERPIEGIITSRYGALSSVRSSAHTGLDIANHIGTDIKAAASGKVKKAEYSGNYGNLVIIEHDNGVETYYAHCSKLYVKVGDIVEQGDVIAAVGSTGNSTGPHLHFEIRLDGITLNPQKYLYR